jgi:Uma2 family endonuclease
MATVAPRADQPTGSAADRDALYEVIDSQVVEKPPIGALQGVFAAIFGHLLADYVHTHKLGMVIQKVLFKIHATRDLKRRPDIALVSRDRWPAGRLPPDREFWDLVPDLAIEVISPTNAATEVMEKIDEYFQAGVRLVWVIYPVQRKVHVYDSPHTSRVLSVENVLDGGVVVPGFEISVREMFDTETR